MYKYTIYCTKEQTEKAWELGAPLYHLDKMQSEGFDENPYKDDYRDRTKLNIGLYAFCPTAEQMINWLEEEEKVEIIITKGIDCYVFNLYSSQKYIDGCINGYNTRREAILGAIDMALYYVSKNKK